MTAGGAGFILRPVMKKPSLPDTIKSLRVGGCPAIVQDYKERMRAHNYATSFDYQIKTRRRIGFPGFEVFRIR